MIWCVEDDASIRDIEVYALRSTGFEACGFADGAAFWQALQTEEQPELVTSRETLRQMLHFVYNEQHRPEAEEGEHDDLVMAAAICHFARSQQRVTMDGGRAADTSRWTEDMWEDYRAADEEGKRRLMELWT